mgnify:CR=1 FL=1
MRDFKAQDLIYSKIFDEVQKLKITHEPRNPLVMRYLPAAFAALSIQAPIFL